MSFEIRPNTLPSGLRCSLALPRFLFRRVKAAEDEMPDMKSQTTLFNESERTDYLVTLAHMVGADGEVTSEEIYALRKLSEELVLGPLNRGRVMAATTGTSDMSEVLARLSTTKLKYGLLLDLCLTGYWDGKLTDDEVQELHQLSEGLKVETAQVDAWATRSSKFS
ncbi:MAG TPA: TerB family tellurite resistance protein [Phycisphaerales bacterium]|nr:TerB family tellurite resistance protein [Phycisphaerales bacterium]